MDFFDIQILDSMECFPCSGDQSVLHGMTRLGRKGIPLGCRGGACGVCKVEVISGQFEVKAMSRSHVSEADEKEGRVLACRIQPRTNLQLKVIGKIKRAIQRPSTSSQTE